MGCAAQPSSEGQPLELEYSSGRLPFDDGWNCLVFVVSAAVLHRCRGHLHERFLERRTDLDQFVQDDALARRDFTDEFGLDAVNLESRRRRRSDRSFCPGQEFLQRGESSSSQRRHFATRSWRRICRCSVLVESPTEEACCICRP